MPFFSFSLDTFQITDTRSVHTDTDFGVLTVAVGFENPVVHTVFSPPYGNLNNGTFKGNMSIPAVEVGPDSRVTMNYMILNAGFSTKAAIDTALGNVSTAVAKAPNPALRFISCLQAIAEDYAALLNPVLRPGCDGLVAAEQDTFSYQELVKFTSSSPSSLKQTTTHTNANPSGCNHRPSNYIVHWSMQEVVDVPMVIDELFPKAVSDVRGAGFGVLPTGSGPYCGRQSLSGFQAARSTVTLTAAKIAP